MANFTCPYCYKGYDKKLIKYVCADCEAEAVPTGKEPIKCQAGDCGGLATRRVCPNPNCDGGDIPRTALQTPNLLFSIVGVSTSGKTNYITVMLNELMNFSGLRLALSHQTIDTRDHQKKNKHNLYDLQRPVDATDRGGAKSQIWSIKNLAQAGRGVPTYTFTIYDGAGEDHTDMVNVDYIRSSEAFIIVLDPLILDGVRDFVDPEVIRKSYKEDAQYMEASEIVSNLITYIKDIKGVPADKTLDMPVAVVLTKFDTVRNHPLFRSANKDSSSVIVNGKVREEEFEEVHNEIENWLRHIGEHNFLNTLDGSFVKLDRKGRIKERYYRLFAVSSYGSIPQEEGTVPKINPHRVLDPILWLFKKKKFID